MLSRDNLPLAVITDLDETALDNSPNEVHQFLAGRYPDREMRQLYFDRFVQMKEVFYDSLGEDDWTWQQEGMDEHGRSIGTIYKQLTGVNIFRNEDWPAIISFLKPRIIALDGFWSMVRYQFPNLG